MSLCPASTRRRAIGKPIFPSPMNPMSMEVSLVFLFLVEFGEGFARQAEAVHGAWYAGVDRHLHQDLANLVLADTVGQRALDMQLQLVRPVQHRDHGDVEHAARFAWQFVAAPDRAPA